MAVIERKRVLRLSSRQETSVSYKVNTEKVMPDDVVIVRVFMEDGRLFGVYKIAGRDIQGRKSIHFKYFENQVTWMNVNVVKLKE